MLNSSLPCSSDADSVRRDLADRHKASRIELRKRFKRSKSDGDLSADADPDTLARYVLTWGGEWLEKRSRARAVKIFTAP